MDALLDYGPHLVGLLGLIATAALPFLGLKFRWEHVVGIWGFAWLAIGSALGLFWAPEEAMMAEAGRILYVHVPAAWVCMVLFTVAFVAALGYLFTGKLGWDWTVEAAAEVGVLMNALLLVLGAIFGRPTWGTYWTWDPRLTASLVMMLTFIGVLLLRQAVTDPDKRATWTGVATIVAYLNIPITYMSVKWASLHQAPSTSETINGDMWSVLWLCFWALQLISIWFMVRRWRVAKLAAEEQMPAPLGLPSEVV